VAPQIRALAGTIRLSLGDELDLAKITYPDYPGERLQCATIRFWPPSAPGSSISKLVLSLTLSGILVAVA
jgi:hypothetical protein